MKTTFRAALLALVAFGADTVLPPVPTAPPGEGGIVEVPTSSEESNIVEGPLPPGGCNTSEARPTLDILLREAPRTTLTKDGVPGDPLNVALIGTREEMQSAFRTAGWYPADPITVRSSVGITVSVVFNVPYRRAPLSNLYLWGRPQELAFEKQHGKSARMRHHVRFWCSGIGSDGRPIWLGADTFNVSVGRSSRTGRLTHHIDPDIDRERAMMMSDLQQAGQFAESSLVPWTGPTQAQNGGGDCYFTDGNMAVGTLIGRTCGVEVCPPACGKP